MAIRPNATDVATGRMLATRSAPRAVERRRRQSKKAGNLGLDALADVMQVRLLAACGFPAMPGSSSARTASPAPAGGGRPRPSILLGVHMDQHIEHLGVIPGPAAGQLGDTMPSETLIRASTGHGHPPAPVGHRRVRRSCTSMTPQVPVTVCGFSPPPRDRHRCRSARAAPRPGQHRAHPQDHETDQRRRQRLEEAITEQAAADAHRHHQRRGASARRARRWRPASASAGAGPRQACSGTGPSLPASVTSAIHNAAGCSSGSASRSCRRAGGEQKPAPTPARISRAPSTPPSRNGHGRKGWVPSAGLAPWRLANITMKSPNRSDKVCIPSATRLWAWANRPTAICNTVNHVD